MARQKGSKMTDREDPFERWWISNDVYAAITKGQAKAIWDAALAACGDQKQCPECVQNAESGMNFCAFCGRQLWHL